MRANLFICICLCTACGIAQVTDGKAIPQVRVLTIEEGAVTTVNLSPGYTTAVRLPEEATSIVVGNPLSFKAEHAEAESRLVFLKPITTKPAESNVLITTKSGQEISLQIVSPGEAGLRTRVDFLLEYRRPQSVLRDQKEGPTLFLSETKPISAAVRPDVSVKKERADPITEALDRQRANASPRWEGATLQVSVGESVEYEHQTILAFSVHNGSKQTVELLTPQIVLSGRAGKDNGQQIKAEPIGIGQYRLTRKRLEPGERADGIVVFARPTFKESSEKLELQIAESRQVDHPVRVPVPFVQRLQESPNEPDRKWSSKRCCCTTRGSCTGAIRSRTRAGRTSRQGTVCS